MYNKISNIPMFDECFIGRKDIIKKLKEGFRQETYLSIQALVGLGGIGKSCIARNYAINNSDNYDLVWWFDAEKEENLKIQIAKLAQMLDILDYHKMDTDAIVEKIQRKLNHLNKILFVFDNVKSYEEVKKYVFREADILLTSRNPNLKGIHKKHILEVDVFDPGEAEEFILSRLDMDDTEENRKISNRLSIELGCLPLLLEQVTAYLDNNPFMTIESYLTLFREYHNNEGLYEHFSELEVPEDYHNKLTTSIRIILDNINEIDPRANTIINIISILSPEEIPYSLFESNKEYINNYVFKNKKDNDIQQIIIGILYRYSIVKVNKKTASIKMHRIVQYIIREILGKQKIDAINYAIGLFDIFKFSSDKQETWGLSRKLYPQIKYVLDEVWNRQYEINDKSLLYHLYDEMAEYLYWMLDYESDEMLIKRMMKLQKEDFPNDLKKYETNLNNLGHLYEKMNRLDEAGEMLEECLKLTISRCGLYSQEVASTLNNIGLVELKQGKSQCKEGKCKSAEEKFTQALNIDKELFGDESEEVFIDLNNIGLAKNYLNKNDEAKKTYRRALDVGKKCLGEKSMRLTSVFFNLATILATSTDLEDLKEAYNCLRESINIRCDFYGKYNDVTLVQMLACARLAEMFDDTLAIKKFDEVLKAAIKLYGDNSIEILKYILALGEKYLDLKKIPEAKTIFLQGKKIIEYNNIDAYSEMVGWIYFYLSYIYEQEEDIGNSIKMLEIILKLDNATNININTYLLDIRKKLSLLYDKAERYTAAVEQYEEVVKLSYSVKDIDYGEIVCALIRESKLLVKNSNTTEKDNMAMSKAKEALDTSMLDQKAVSRIRAYDNLGYIFICMNNIDEAKNNLEQAKKILINNNIKQECLNSQVYLHLGDVLYEMKEYRQAKENYEIGLRDSIDLDENEENQYTFYLGLAEVAAAQADFIGVFNFYKSILKHDIKSKGKESVDVYDDLCTMAECLKRVKKDEIIVYIDEINVYLKEILLFIEKTHGIGSNEYNKYSELMNNIRQIPTSHCREKTTMDNNRGKYIGQAKAKELISICDILIITATDLETKYLFDKITPLPKEEKLLIATIGSHTYTIGQLGYFAIIHVQCEPGAVMSNASMLTTKDAVDFWKPKIVIMVGIAFGMNSKEDNIGDVLVSNKICSYEVKKITTNENGEKEEIQRSTIAEAGNILRDRFKNLGRDWEHSLADGSKSKILVGQIVSGEKLINNMEYKKEIMRAYPEAIGGEMEAMGVYVATRSLNCLEWIIVKGICDWADGNKDHNKEKNQIEAITSAVSLCEFIMNNEFCFESLDVNRVDTNYQR